ncbi:MAG: ankyrin repeat domain-containing protein [Spirochaetota bacterium]|nr:ankyrin repeat domain-containing protein [Spirochaetota bacterium]
MIRKLLISLILLTGLTACSVSDKDLLDAAKRGRLDKIKSLIEKGANINASDRFGKTTLHYMAGYDKMVAYLISKGAKVRALTAIGESPLLFAAEKGNTKSVQLLLDKGADINVSTGFGDSPLEKAITGGHLNAVKLLLKKGAELSKRRKSEGWTPVLAAVASGNKEIVKYLISNGAKVDATLKNGKTIMDLAKNKDIKNLLKEHLDKEKKPGANNKMGSAKSKK